MKKVMISKSKTSSKKRRIPKEIFFRQHIVIGILTCLGIGLIVTKAAFIAPSFWNTNPSTGAIFDSLYSGTTSYTELMSGRNNQCNKSAMNVYFITGGTDLQINQVPNIITENSIYVLNSGTYIFNYPTITLSGNCIALLGSGTVSIRTTINLQNAKWSILDNIDNDSHYIQCNTYTNTGTINCTIGTDGIGNYTISGDTQETKTGAIYYGSQTLPISIKNLNTGNTLDITIYNDTNVLNHKSRFSIHDNTAPTITGTLLYTTTKISEGGIYNTGVTITVSDKNLSGLSNYGNILSGTTQTFTTQGIYAIEAWDLAGNRTGIHFEIDTTPPYVTSMSPMSGEKKESTKMSFSRASQENTTKIASQKLYLKDPTNTRTTTGIQPGINNIDLDNNNGTYTRYIVIQDTAGNVYTGDQQTFSFTKIHQISVTPKNGNYVNGIRYVKTNPIVTITGNKNFTYSILSGANVINDLYSGTPKEETINLSPRTGMRNIYVTYMTVNQESGTLPMSFFTDKDLPQAVLLPKGTRQNTTNQIVYTWNGSYDASSPIVLYNFIINDKIVYSGLNTSYTLTGIEINKTYTAQVKATDQAGNEGRSTAESTTIDVTPPRIYNAENGKVYNTVKNPIIIDENNTPIIVKIQKNNVQIESGYQNSPYSPSSIQGGEASYVISATDIAGNTTGVSFSIDTTPPTISATAPSSGTRISGNNSVSFSWTTNDANMSGYLLSLSSQSQGYFTTGIVVGNVNATTINNLSNGEYLRQITAIDKAGNQTISPLSKLTINVPFTGTFNITNGTAIGSGLYTKESKVSIYNYLNKGTLVEITGDIAEGYTGIIMPAGTSITTLQLSTGDGIKKIYLSASTGYSYYNNVESIRKALSMVVDTMGPTAPTLSGIATSYTGGFTLLWNASTDLGAGVSTYTYKISSGSTTSKQGSVSTNAITFANMDLGLNGNFLLQIQATDALGNTGERSIPGVFSYVGIPDTSPDAFSFAKQYDATPDKTYTSTSITVAGLSNNTTLQASIDEGTLYINGTDVGTQGTVKNGDTVYIKLLSSEDYNDLTTATLTIGDKAATFKIVTEDDPDEDNSSDDESSDDSSSLSSSQMLEMASLLSSIGNTYGSQSSSIMTTFQTMLQDKMQTMIQDGASDSEIANLLYLSQLINKNYSTTSNTSYTAPNGKTYAISYDSSKGYTSSNFLSSGKYFNTLEEIKAYIDKNNQKNASSNYSINQSRSSAPYKAPNGKVYNFFKTTDGKYGSYNFIIAKTFTTLTEMKSYINKNNPKK